MKTAYLAVYTFDRMPIPKGDIRADVNLIRFSVRSDGFAYPLGRYVEEFDAGLDIAFGSKVYDKVLFFPSPAGRGSLA